MVLDAFHPAVARWFERQFGQPTAAQAEAWPSIAGGQHTLIAAPTGSGKTLAAFLAAIDGLVKDALNAPLPDAVQVLYVSPLKALSNDIHKNLDGPLEAIAAELEKDGQLYGHGGSHDIRIAVRTGDTPASERNKMRRKPPHILVTTPESLYILLTSDSGRAILSSVSTLIVDEIHALANNKRGSHLTLSLERLSALTSKPLTRVGLSATQKPIDEVARFLLGNRDEPVNIIDSGHSRHRDLALELPKSPLEAVMSAEVWAELYERIAGFTESHRTTLVFVNTRRYAERVAHHLAELIGEEFVAAHHGSLSRDHRLEAEQRLKHGQLKIMVATASLELGIDIGDVELVCQLGSPKAIAAFLQRVGRSGHAVTGTPKGRLFPLSRDDLLECAALLEAVNRGELDRLIIPVAPLDVLAQQIVAEVACAEWQAEDLYQQCRKAHPYRDLKRADFDKLVHMLAEGFSTRWGRRGAHVHFDAVNDRLRPRKGARLTAVTNGGAIPDLFDYDVRLEPDGLFVGTLNEDFAFESLPGDIFQLGNTSYRVRRVEMGTVHVDDAHGQPPSIPFWFGEAPGRSDELSMAVSRLRAEAETLLKKSEPGSYPLTLLNHYQQLIPEAGARQLAEYLAAAWASLGCLPTRERIVLERFFDEAGDMHLVVHSPYGSRMNRAWGLSLRKRFCRSFNFELQAAALEDTIVLSLSSTHSFELEEVSRYLNSKGVRDLLIQAMFDAPMFGSRWRWNATTALAIQRFRSGKRVAPQLQRMSAEDLVAVVFPDQLACLENIAGDRDIPDHPLIQQTITDCLHEAMDIEALETLLSRLEAGEIDVVAHDLPEPSMLAREILSARPYAFLDDAPAEERRTQMVQARRHVSPKDAADVAQLDPMAIQRVREEAWPDARDDDELHDALMLSGGLPASAPCQHDAPIPLDWQPFMDQLIADGRATRIAGLWGATERLPLLQAIYPEAGCVPPVTIPEQLQQDWDGADARRELIRGHMEICGPITAEELARRFALPAGDIGIALVQLEGEGFVFRGRYTGSSDSEEWCERRLLARIHRYTVKKLRAEIEPVSATQAMRFLLRWQGLEQAASTREGRIDAERKGPEALAKILEQLEGIEAPAGAWESAILPARLPDYAGSWLDELAAAGRVMWTRLSPPTAQSGPVKQTSLSLIARRQRRYWASLKPAELPELSSTAQGLLSELREGGAAFFEDLLDDTGLLPAQAEQAIAELAGQGLIHSDRFTGLRALITPASKRGSANPGRHAKGRGRRSGGGRSVIEAGRWSALRPLREYPEDRVEVVVRTLLRRYGVLVRALIQREISSLPSWREMLYVLRRLEARGEIRGGRFVAGFSGEQYALPEAVKGLRQARKDEKDDLPGPMIAISAADPLNLTDQLLPAPRIPAQTGNRLLFQSGHLIAWQVGGKTGFADEPDEATQWRLEQALQGRIQKLVPNPMAKPPSRWAN